MWRSHKYSKCTKASEKSCTGGDRVHRALTRLSACLLLLPAGGVVSSRVVESYLWECKQLGAYSPIVLLNTLLFFCTKTFHFRTLAQHQGLSFANFTRCSKPCNRTGKVHYLRYHRRIRGAPYREETGGRSKITRLYPLQVQTYQISKCAWKQRLAESLFFFLSERLRKRQTGEEEELEMLENVTNPLHCPVRLYEFYLSRW